VPPFDLPKRSRVPCEALSLINCDLDFDLLFTDVIMPGSMNGRDLADEAAKLREPLKVLFTSGFSENAVVHDGMVDRGVLLLVKLMLDD
jgi:YesN/AraC family two-component response regulator